MIVIGFCAGFVLSSCFCHRKRVWFLCLLSNAPVEHIEQAIDGIIFLAGLGFEVLGFKI